MFKPHDRSAAFRACCAMTVVLGVLFACAVSEVHRLAESRLLLRDETLANLEEERTALRLQNIVEQMGTAIRDLVLADQPADIRPAQARLHELREQYDLDDTRLRGLLRADPAVAAGERELLQIVAHERRATGELLDNVETLAVKNRDAAASAMLRDLVLPHRTRWRTALADFARLEQMQNQALALRPDDAYEFFATAAVVLGTLGALMLAATAWCGARAWPARRSAASAMDVSDLADR